MTKPVVFFSHSSKDAVVLRRLKDRFLELTGSTIDVFLSSDGQSIRLGKNWVASIEQALSDAALMFVFLSPRSVSSPWVYFESGHAYAKKLDVIPVGLFGIDIGSTPPPLSILQGFNVVGHESLNNLIAKVNERFNHAHKLGFSRDDYEALQSASEFAGSRILGNHAGAVDTLELIAKRSGIALDAFLGVLEAIEQPKLVRGSTCAIPGASLSLAISSKAAPGGNELHCSVDPGLASLALPVAEGIFQKAMDARPNGEMLGYSMIILMRSRVTWETRDHVVMARLHGSGATLATDDKAETDKARFELGNLYFRLEHFVSGPAISVECRGKSFADSNVGSVLDLLFECGVLRYQELDA